MRKRTSPDRIASTLRDIQADLDAGLNVNQACRKASINPTTYYRWKALQENPASIEQIRVSELEAEVGRLKLLVAELALDRRMLQEALKKSHDRRPSPPHRRRIMRPLPRLATSRLSGVGPGPVQPALRAGRQRRAV